MSLNGEEYHLQGLCRYDVLPILNTGGANESRCRVHHHRAGSCIDFMNRSSESHPESARSLIRVMLPGWIYENHYC